MQYCYIAMKVQAKKLGFAVLVYMAGKSHHSPDSHCCAVLSSGRRIDLHTLAATLRLLAPMRDCFARSRTTGTAVHLRSGTAVIERVMLQAARPVSIHILMQPGAAL